MIIGPPGPTGEIVITLSEPGWTIGEGSGVRKMSPGRVGPAFSTVICGGVNPGSDANDCSFEGWVCGRLSTGGIIPRRATGNAVWSGGRPWSLIVTETCSPWANGTKGTKLAPCPPE